MVRTRVGYTGGRLHDPTYYHLGDHTESLQVDYDPSQISYEQLLTIFWNSHNPTRRAWSQQYKAAVFVHNDEQKRLALETKEQLAREKTGRFFNRKIQTEVILASTFYLAETYHQKYLLQNSPKLWGEIIDIYRGSEEWINSTAAARLNGYVGGYGTLDQLEKEIDSLGLPGTRQEELRRIV